MERSVIRDRPLQPDGEKILGRNALALFGIGR